MLKKLGQHFLINKSKIKKIVEALKLKDGDVIIEIGSGHGELTDELVKKFISLKVDKFKIIAIEKDKELAKNLELRIKNLGIKNTEIIEGDALKLLTRLTNDLRQTTSDYKIAGNIPYYITGYLLRILGQLENKPSLIVLTIQKEVAERICKPRMNLLAAAVQFWTKPEIVGNIPKKDFKPMPKVDSAIIKLIPLNVTRLRNIDDEEDYYRLIKILFKQPRKTILNNLKSQILNLKNKEEIIKKLEKAGVNPNDRPQDLNLEQIMKLSTCFKKYKHYNKNNED